jgi:hypothetical protein
MTQQYKNDGFDLSKTTALPSTSSSFFFAIVDLEQLKIIGLYTNEQLVETELARLKNSAEDMVTTVLSFPKALTDTPAATVRLNWTEVIN